MTKILCTINTSTTSPTSYEPPYSRANKLNLRMNRYSLRIDEERLIENKSQQHKKVNKVNYLALVRVTMII